MESRPVPVFAPLAGGRVSVHATTVAVEGRALLLCGPSGSGKSGTAAQMLALGAALVVDDLTVLSRENGALRAMAPEGAVAAMELRGFGLVPVALAGPCPVAALVWLGPPAARMPERERLRVLEGEVTLLRHPAAPDLAAKLLLWARAAGDLGADLQ